MKSIRREIARLREYALARRGERERRCVCRLVFVEGEPTPAQAEDIVRNATCKADHSAGGFSVVEVPPMPEWMSRGERPPHASED